MDLSFGMISHSSAPIPNSLISSEPGERSPPSSSCQKENFFKLVKSILILIFMDVYANKIKTWNQVCNDTKAGNSRRQFSAKKVRMKMARRQHSPACSSGGLDSGIQLWIAFSVQIMQTELHFWMTNFLAKFQLWIIMMK